MGRKRPKVGRCWSAVFLFLIIIAGLSVTSPPVQGATATLSLHMVGEAPRFDVGTPVLVAGVWHQVTVNLSAAFSAPLVLRAAVPGASPPSMSNTYQWVRNEANDSWYDVLYGTFLRTDLSSDDGQHIVFAVGVDGLASPGMWTFTASQGNLTLVSQTVEIQAPQLSYAISAADFQFRVDPFTSADLSSQTGGQYIRLNDQGNVPLRLATSFDIFQTALGLANPSTVTHPGTSSIYFLHFVVGPLSPQIARVAGIATVAVLYVIPSPGQTILTPTFEQPFSVTVNVGRSGYMLKVVGGVVFQTLDSLHADYGAVATWQVYLTGRQNVTLDAVASGVRLIGAFVGGSALALPAVLSLSADAEYPVTIQVDVNQGGSATVTFTLHLLSTGDIQTFTTTILVNGGPPSSASTATYLWIFGSVAAALVFGLVTFGQWRSRRGGTVRRVTAVENSGKEKRGYNARRRTRNQRRRNRTNENGTKGAKGKSSKPGTTRNR